MIATRIRPRCKSLMAGLLLERPSMQSGQEHLAAASARLGIEDLRIIKARNDSTIVARGYQREWGCVAIKVSNPIAVPTIAFTALGAHEFYSANPASIFPRIHSFGLGYAVTEWIKGGDAAFLDPEMTRRLPVIPFVDSLVSWFHSCSEGTNLSVWEILSAARCFLEASVRRMEYQSGAGCLVAATRLSAERGQLGRFLDEMASLAPELELDRGMMLSDLNPRNIRYDWDEGRLVYIDLEPVRTGNVLFDVVFLLCRMIIRQMPGDLTRSLAEHIFSENFMPAEHTSRFFKLFSKCIVTGYMTVDGRSRDSIQAGLSVIPGGA